MFIPSKEYQEIQEKIPIACVDLLITYNKKILLLKRNASPARGLFWFPGGRINKMETIEKAAIRKAREEVHLDCTFIKQICVEETIFLEEKSLPIHTVNICCLLETTDISKLKLDNSHTEFKWVDSTEKNLHPAVSHPLLLFYRHESS